MQPLSVSEVLRPSNRDARRAARLTNVLLLAPVTGAFVQIVWTHSLPWLGWPFLVLIAALFTRLLASKGMIRERNAQLGLDGVSLVDRFVPVVDLAEVTRTGDVVWVRTQAHDTIELRLEVDGSDRAAAIMSGLHQAMAFAAAPRDGAGERFLADLNGAELRGSPEAYRGLPFDAARCIELVEDVVAAPKARIEAARILRTHPDPQVRTRIADAAHSTANPLLRQALLDAADGPVSQPQAQRLEASDPPRRALRR